MSFRRGYRRRRSITQITRIILFLAVSRWFPETGFWDSDAKEEQRGECKLWSAERSETGINCSESKEKKEFTVCSDVTTTTTAAVEVVDYAVFFPTFLSIFSGIKLTYLF